MRLSSVGEINIQTLKHLAVITSNYPSPGQPTHGTFVREFVRAVAKRNIEVSVIAPIARHRARDSSAFPIREQISANQSGQIQVFRPRYLSVSAWNRLKFMGNLNPSRITYVGFLRAVQKTITSNRLNPTALYGHFLYMSGATAVGIGSKWNIPAFPCVGEGEMWTLERFGLKTAQRDLKNAKGFIANNSFLGSFISESLGFEDQPKIVLPNGCDLTRFKPLNKVDCRKHFGLPDKTFLVCSIGNFSHKKGIARTAEAIRDLPNVAGVFAGAGPETPACENIAFCGKVKHDEIPRLLNACDVFVLPTLVEGSCNAIVEAIACGLPIISSNYPFNDDLLDDSMSIKIDPLSIDEIRKAIHMLSSNTSLQNSMSANSLAKSKSLDVNIRAEKIVSFIESQL